MTRYLRPGGLHFEDVLSLRRVFAEHRFNRKRDVARHFVDVGDLKARLGLHAHDDVVEDEAVLVLAVHAPALHLVGVLPNAQVLAHAVLLEDGADVGEVNRGNAGLGQQAVRYTANIV